jgi:hypothetical protein
MKNKEFLGSVDTNPFRFPHYISYFALYVNGKQIPSGGMHLDTGREKTTVIEYRTLFYASGIRHSDTGLRTTHDMYVDGYFMLLFDLTPDNGAAEGHTSHPDSGNVRIVLKFKKELPDAIILPIVPGIRQLCSHRIVANFHDEFLIILTMDTRQLMCCLRDVRSFLGVFPFDLLPPHSIVQSGTLIINADPRTQRRVRNG